MKFDKRKRMFISGAFFAGLIILLALLGPVLCQYDPLEMNVTHRLMPPSSDHLFGTDYFGRDLLARVLVGARITMVIGISVVGISCVIGVFIGLLAGYYKPLDVVLMRIMDSMMAFPSILLAMVLVAALGSGIPNIILALALSNVPGIGRMTRGVVLYVKQLEHVEAAEASGAGDFRIILKHVLPLCWPAIIVSLTTILANTALAEASLTFLGVGLQPDIPSWGNIINEGRMVVSRAPWVSVIPGVFIMLTVFSFNIMGDSLRDLLDPRLNSNQ